MDASFAIPFDWLVLLYVAAALLVSLGLWFYYENRDAKAYRELATSSLFHCIKCGDLYQVRGERESADCPTCAKNNLRLRF